VLLFTVPITET